jgi:hypothetical protein
MKDESGKMKDERGERKEDWCGEGRSPKRKKRSEDLF